MEKYKDVTMFVCGCIVGALLMLMLTGDSGKGKVPVTSQKSLESKPSAKIAFIDSLDERKAGAIMRCLNFVPADLNAYREWIIETEPQRLIRCLVKN